jgi:hypothetical protein
MPTYKVKYATRNKLARALQMEVKDLGLYDEGSLYESIRISAMQSDNFNNITITVNALYYFYFLDKGTIYIAPQKIIQKWLASSEVQAITSEIMQDFIRWQFEVYPLLEMARILNNPKMFLEFNWIDEEELPYSLPESSTLL